MSSSAKLQKFVPLEKLGRVRSIDMFGTFSLMPVGYAVAGVLSDHIQSCWFFNVSDDMNVVLTYRTLSVRGMRDLE